MHQNNAMGRLCNLIEFSEKRCHQRRGINPESQNFAAANTGNNQAAVAYLCETHKYYVIDRI